MKVSSTVLRRLHSLTGVLPVGLFLMEHLYSNAATARGPEHFNAVIRFFSSIPFLIVLELGLVGALLYHGLVGIWISFTGRSNVALYRYPRNWMYSLQRVSGLITFPFVLYHLWQFRLGRVIFGFELDYEVVRQTIVNPWVSFIYVLGVMAAAFHFGNGLWSFSIVWGIATGPKAQSAAGWVGNSIGAILYLLGMISLYGLDVPLLTIVISSAISVAGGVLLAYLPGLRARLALGAP
ncbi:MAG: succinate dehydrogenase [Deinococcus sp.]|nr:succinate dehydrogenase [Deinococcus sp.]